MDRSWNDMLRIGMVHSMAFPETLGGEGPLLETISEILEDDFFTAIEVSWVKNPEVRKQISDALRSSYTGVVYCGEPPILTSDINLSSLEDPVRRRAVEDVKSLVDEAGELGAELATILSGRDLDRTRGARQRRFSWTRSQRSATMPSPTA